jgi:hypothetical protein
LRRAEGGAKIFEVFRVKNHDFTPKNPIFFQFYGARAGYPVSAPEYYTYDNFGVTKIKYIMHNVQFIAFFIITLFTLLYVKVGILLTYWKHLHDRIISLSRETCARKTSIALPLFIEVSVLSLESEWSCICVVEVSIDSFNDFSIGFFNCSANVVFVVCHVNPLEKIQPCSTPEDQRIVLLQT